MGSTATTDLDQILAHIDHDVFIGQVREIGADEGEWDHKIAFDVKEVQKGLKAAGEDAPEPMFVEVLVLHEGHSVKTDGTENIGYAARTVHDVAKLLPGAIGYLGHPQPGTEEWKYRTPVARYVASRVERRDVPNVGTVPCAVGKAYISAAAKELRTHIREGMAGPVSLNGTAFFKAVRGRRTNETVGMKQLKSVDFCNPGTAGIPAAGITGVVREIAGEGGDPTQGDKSMGVETNPTIRSKADLLREYPEFCQAVINDETASLNSTLEEVREQKAKADETVATLQGEKETLEAKVEEMTKAHTEATERAEKSEKTVREMQNAVALGKVKDALQKKISERIEAAKSGENAKAEVAVLEMARDDFALDATVLAEKDDENLTLSLKAAESAFDGKVSEVRKFAEKFGTPGSADVKETATGGTVTTKNKGEGGLKYEDLLPATAKRMKREQGVTE